mgnify:CR=1 FL=1
MWNWNITGIKDYDFEGAFNRTNVELKLRCEYKAGYGNALLIVPMWNWNQDAWEIYIMLLSFNRTNVELKYFLLPHPVSSIRAFNRTNVELKYATGLTMTAGYNLLIVPMWNWNRWQLWPAYRFLRAFNRTNVELKCRQYKLLPEAWHF